MDIGTVTFKQKKNYNLKIYTVSGCKSSIVCFTVANDSSRNY